MKNGWKKVSNSFWVRAAPKSWSKYTTMEIILDLDYCEDLNNNLSKYRLFVVSYSYNIYYCPLTSSFNYWQDYSTPIWKCVYKRAKLTGSLNKHRGIFIKDGRITLSLFVEHLLLEGVVNCTECKLVYEFHQQKDDAENESRNRLRDALRKWHPDKFGQLTQGRIPDEEEKKKICGVVTHISQVLINYGK